MACGELLNMLRLIYCMSVSSAGAKCIRGGESMPPPRPGTLRCIGRSINDIGKRSLRTKFGEQSLRGIYRGESLEINLANKVCMTNIALSDMTLRRVMVSPQRLPPDIIMSTDLKHYDTLPRGLLDGSRCVVILYETAPNFGHWVLLHTLRSPQSGKQTLEFFDSYGMKPDDELNHIPSQYRHDSKQTKKEVVRLLLASPEDIPISYNEHTFQVPYPGINTCGRWVILRYLCGLSPWGASLEGFKQFIDVVSKRNNVSPDVLAVMLTEVGQPTK